MIACVICAHAGPQRHYQVGEGHQAHQVEKYVEEMSLAPVSDPAERKKVGDGKI